MKIRISELKKIIKEELQLAEASWQATATMSTVHNIDNLLQSVSSEVRSVWRKRPEEHERLMRMSKLVAELRRENGELAD